MSSSNTNGKDKVQVYFGPYSTVYKQNNYAVKVIDKDISVPPHHYKKELHFLQSFNHHNVIKLIKVEHKFDDILLYMNWYPYTLADYVVSNCKKRTRFGSNGEISVYYDNKLPYESSIKILSQIIDAIRYIHGQGVIHRDIKPSNILVSEAEEIVVCDFSVSVNVKDNDLITDVCSGYYKPLELVFGLDYGLEIDIWSFGILVSMVFSKDGKNILYDSGDLDDKEGLSDFTLIDRVFKVFGTPTKDEKSVNYWPRIFEVDNFSIIDLKPRERMAAKKIFPACPDEEMVELFNKVCCLDSQRRMGIDEVKRKFESIRGGA